MIIEWRFHANISSVRHEDLSLMQLIWIYEALDNIWAEISCDETMENIWGEQQLNCLRF